MLPFCFGRGQVFRSNRKDRTIRWAKTMDRFGKRGLGFGQVERPDRWEREGPDRFAPLSVVGSFDLTMLPFCFGRGQVFRSNRTDRTIRWAKTMDRFEKLSFGFGQVKRPDRLEGYERPDRWEREGPDRLEGYERPDDLKEVEKTLPL